MPTPCPQILGTKHLAGLFRPPGSVHAFAEAAGKCFVVDCPAQSTKAFVPASYKQAAKSPSRGPRAKQRRGGLYFDPGHLFAACRGADSIFTLFRILPPCTPVSRTRRYEDSNLTLTGMGDRRSWQRKKLRTETRTPPPSMRPQTHTPIILRNAPGTLPRCRCRHRSAQSATPHL